MQTARLLLSLLAFCGAATLRAQTSWTTTGTHLNGSNELVGIAYGNGMFVATSLFAGQSGTVTSTDGVNWNFTLGGGPWGGAILFNGGYFYQLGSNGIWRSPQARVWDLIYSTKTADATNFNFLASNGSSMLASVNAADGTLIFSPDFSTFSRTAALPNTAGATQVQINAIAVLGTTYYAVYLVQSGGAFANYAAKMSDGHSWTLVPELAGADALASGNGRLVAHGALAMITTTDGVSFQSSPFPPNTYNSNLYFAGGRFLLGYPLLASTDGVNWAALAPVNYPTESALGAVAYGNGRFVAVGGNPAPAGGGSLAATDLVVWLETDGPPNFLTQPQDIAITSGQNGSLVTTVAGGRSLPIQWYKNGSPVPGATGASLAFTPASPTDAGTYYAVVSNSWGSATSSTANVTVGPSNPPRLVNFSLRSNAGQGDQTLIVGFALSGPAAKTVLIRGVGPGLVPFSITDFLPDPQVAVFSGNTQIAYNDNWSLDDGRNDGAFQLAAGSKDAVAGYYFSAGSYTAQVTGVGGTTGEAIAELYDASVPNATIHLVNLSARTMLGDGQRLIVGFTTVGDSPAKIVLRAIGPTLAAFNVATPHPDPRIELYSGSTKIAENDNWSGDDGRSAGAFPLFPGTKDAVIAQTLATGAYTLHVFGPPGTSGIVLVELYQEQ